MRLPMYRWSIYMPQTLTRASSVQACSQPERTCVHLIRKICIRQYLAFGIKMSNHGVDQSPRAANPPPPPSTLASCIHMLIIVLLYSPFPIKHNICVTFIQRRQTLVKHCKNVIQMFCVCWYRYQINICIVFINLIL